MGNKCELLQSRIQDFSEVGALTLQGDVNRRFCQKFPKNCMKLKEFGPGGASKILLCRSATALVYRLIIGGSLIRATFSVYERFLAT